MSCPPLESLGENFGRRGKEEKGKEKEKRRKQKREARENGEEQKRNCKYGGGKLKMTFLVFFARHFFKTTEICLGCSKIEIATGKKSGKGKFSNLAHLWLHSWLCP